MSENKIMDDHELKGVAGGLTEQEKKEISDSWDELIKSKGFMDMKCHICGKTFPYSKYLLFDWSGKDLDGSHHYEISTCPECKQKYPFVKNKNI